MFDGRLNASSRPVMVADRSPSVEGLLSMNLVMNHSKKRHDRTDVTVTISAPTPNTVNEARSAGMSAHITQRMFLSMVSPQWICGDVDIYSF